MQDPRLADKHWQIYLFCDLSRQFTEAYRAYVRRSSQRLAQRTVADAVELFLVCHALELALKGWLLLRMPGMTVSKLKRQYGHNLIKLANEVLPQYPNIQPHLSLIAALSRWGDIDEPFNHRDYGYPDVEDKGIPVPMPLDPFADFVAQCRFDLYLALERERSAEQEGSSHGGS